MDPPPHLLRQADQREGGWGPSEGVWCRGKRRDSLSCQTGSSGEGGGFGVGREAKGAAFSVAKPGRRALGAQDASPPGAPLSHRGSPTAGLHAPGGLGTC